MNDDKLEELAYQCPGTVKAGAWMFIVLACLGLMVQFALLPTDLREHNTRTLLMSGHSWRVSIWVALTALAVFTGLLVAVGRQVLKGKMWAYYVMGLLVVNGIISDIVNGSRVREGLRVPGPSVDLFDIVILLLLLVGYRGYREFSKSRNATQQIVAGS